MKQIILLTLMFSLFNFAACKNEHENHQTSTDSYYTCPMHPSVVSKTPGVCPVCNMSLIKVEKKATAPPGQQGNFITIDQSKQTLAGIKTDTVKFRSILSSSTITGTVAIDEQGVKVISSRVNGRIDKLFVKSTGAYLKKGSPVYSIYSEQLLADEKEYLSLLEKAKTANTTTSIINEFVNAAKNKLVLWGLTAKQISDLKTSRNPNPLITFFSPESGYVSAVKITEGMYVSEGSPIMEITSLNQVWVEAQIYSNEIARIAENKTFQIISDSDPNEIYNGTLVYNNPVLEEGKRIQFLKISVTNPNGKLIPGMLVSVRSQKSNQQILAVPKTAVLLEKMKTVWVLAHENTFQQRMVETGEENNQWVEIISGLNGGDIIVTEGAYLISSEFILKSGAGQRHDH